MNIIYWQLSNSWLSEHLCDKLKLEIVSVLAKFHFYVLYKWPLIVDYQTLQKHFHIC